MPRLVARGASEADVTGPPHTVLMFSAPRPHGASEVPRPPRAPARGRPTIAALFVWGAREPDADALARDLRPFVGAVLPGSGVRGTIFVAPPDHGALYGGLKPWANVVREYVRGRGASASVAVGFDPPYAAAIAASRRAGVTVLASANQERERALAVPLRDLGLGVRACKTLGGAGVRTLGALLAVDDPAFLAHAGADVLALWSRFPRHHQLGIPFVSAAVARG